MEVFETLFAAVAESLAQSRPGDISTMAELLHDVDVLRDAADDAGRHNLTLVADAVAELVKKIIMEAVADEQAAFTLVSDSLEKLASAGPAGDLDSLEGFSAELGLPKTAGGAAPVGMGSGASDLVDESIVAEFLDQHSGSLGQMEQLILALEQGPNPDALAAIQRMVHTMKGEAGFLGLHDLEMVCHATENFLEAGKFPYDVETILEVKDWMTAALGDLGAGNPISKSAAQILPRLAASNPPGAPTGGAAPPPGTAARNPGSPAAPPAKESAPPAARPPAPPAAPPAAIVIPVPEEGYWTLTADTQLLSDFISESREHMEHANGELLTLETNPSDTEALNSVFRGFHTIKGIASFLELEEIRLLAHDAETLLDLIRKGTVAITRGVIDVAFDSMDMLAAMIEKTKVALGGDGRMEPEAGLVALISEIRAAARGERAQTVAPEGSGARLGEILVEAGTISAGDLHDVLTEERAAPTGAKIGELLVKNKKVPAREVADALRRQGPPAPATGGTPDIRETIRVDYDRLESMVNAIGELVIAESMITQDENITALKSDLIGKKIHNLRMISRQLQQLGTTIRMVPIAGTFQKMTRLVRDLSKKTGKRINFRTSGEETELDRAYVDKIGDPLVHMIRNSVDHGVEEPGERLAAGKKELAEIRLRAFHEGGNIIVEVRDDGRGIDTEAVRAKALERGLITEEDRLSENEVFHLIFHPGFSTAKAVTDVSGRGVGMDVVKRNVEELRGQIQIISEMGVGTTFRIMLPLTMALIDGMVVRVGAERFIFPVLSVVESIRAKPETLHSVLGVGEMISIRGGQLPFFRLAELFAIPGANFKLAETLVVVAENDGRQIALLVDDLVGMQQTVIKNLGGGMGQTEGVAGGAIMVDGTVGLILDIPGVFKIALARTPAQREASRKGHAAEKEAATGGDGPPAETNATGGEAQPPVGAEPSAGGDGTNGNAGAAPANPRTTGEEPGGKALPPSDLKKTDLPSAAGVGLESPEQKPAN